MNKKNDCSLGLSTGRTNVGPIRGNPPILPLERGLVEVSTRLLFRGHYTLLFSSCNVLRSSISCTRRRLRWVEEGEGGDFWQPFLFLLFWNRRRRRRVRAITAELKRKRKKKHYPKRRKKVTGKRGDERDGAWRSEYYLGRICFLYAAFPVSCHV